MLKCYFIYYFAIMPVAGSGPLFNTISSDLTAKEGLMHKTLQIPQVRELEGEYETVGRAGAGLYRLTRRCCVRLSIIFQYLKWSKTEINEGRLTFNFIFNLQSHYFKINRLFEYIYRKLLLNVEYLTNTSIIIVNTNKLIFDILCVRYWPVSETSSFHSIHAA